MGRYVWMIGFLLMWASQAQAYNCENSCKTQCKKGWLGNNVDPVCFSGCQAYQLAKCWDVSDPYVSAWGEAGSKFYPAAAGTTSERNMGRDMRRLSRVEKQLLQPFFGRLVDEVVLHPGARLMGEWGGGAFKITMSDDVGQTYGTHIYLDDSWLKLTEAQKVAVIGHEMCHTRQFQNRGSSLQRFGRDYFEGFANSGGYANNSMERECYDIEAKIEEKAQAHFAWEDQQRRPWNFEVCNKSEYEKIFVAYAFTHFLPEGGFSLVANPYAKGWFAVDRGACKIIRNNLSPGEVIYAAATAGAEGNWASWTAKAGQKFCIDSNQAFTIQGSDHVHCSQESDWGKVGFYSFATPWAWGQGTNTWNLSGGHTRLQICNKSGRKLDSAMLRGDGGWHAIGWYTYEVDQCRTFSFGGYVGDVYIYGKAVDGSGIQWISANEPKFCVFPGVAFNNPQDTPCRGNYETVPGFKFGLQHGLNTWNFNP